MTVTIPRCTYCRSKLPAEGTATYANQKFNLWAMDEGWTEKMRKAYRINYCNTCGRQHDRRRKLHPEHKETT